MVWCGTVWCGAVWRGVVWYGVVWCGVVWYGVVWCGWVRRGVVQCEGEVLMVQCAVEVSETRHLNPGGSSKANKSSNHNLDLLPPFRRGTNQENTG